MKKFYFQNFSKKAIAKKKHSRSTPPIVAETTEVKQAGFARKESRRRHHSPAGCAYSPGSRAMQVVFVQGAGLPGCAQNPPLRQNKRIKRKVIYLT